MSTTDSETERLGRRWRELVNAEESPGLADAIQRALEAAKRGEVIRETRPQARLVGGRGRRGQHTCLEEYDETIHEVRP